MFNKLKQILVLVCRQIIHWGYSENSKKYFFKDFYDQSDTGVCVGYANMGGRIKWL